MNRRKDFCTTAKREGFECCDPASSKFYEIPNDLLPFEFYMGTSKNENLE